MTAPPGTTYETSAAGFCVTVPSVSPPRWLAMPLLLLWIGIAAYAFVIAPKQPDTPASETLIVSAFTALVGIPLVASVVLFRFGRLTIAERDGTGIVTEHIGSLGQTREFAWSALRSVRDVRVQSGRRRAKAIELDLSGARANRRMYVGHNLPDETRRFLLHVLEVEIASGRRDHPLGLES